MPSSSLISVSAASLDSVNAAVTGLQLIDRTLQAQIRRATKELGEGEWAGIVAEHLQGNNLQSAVLGETSKLQASNQNVMLKSGASNRHMRGGATPADLARQEEFGANQNRLTAYRRRSRKGNVSTVLRHTSRQLMPIRRQGWTVYPAAAEFIPRIASLWVQTVMRTIYDALEGKTE